MKHDSLTLYLAKINVSIHFSNWKVNWLPHWGWFPAGPRWWGYPWRGSQAPVCHREEVRRRPPGRAHCAGCHAPRRGDRALLAPPLATACSCDRLSPSSLSGTCFALKRPHQNSLLQPPTQRPSRDSGAWAERGEARGGRRATPPDLTSHPALGSGGRNDSWAPVGIYHFRSAGMTGVCELGCSLHFRCCPGSIK